MTKRKSLPVDRAAPLGEAAAHRLARQRVFTSGEAAALCAVSTRTVGKWVDTGRLEGFRLPGSSDRRVPRDALVRFMTRAGIPLGPLARDHRSVALLAGVGERWAAQLTQLLSPEFWAVRTCQTLLDAAALAATVRPDAVVLSAALGTGPCREAAARFRSVLPGAALIGVLADDDRDASPYDLAAPGLPALDAAALLCRKGGAA